MAEVAVSLLAQGDEIHIVTDLAKKAGRRVAAIYSQCFTKFYALLRDHPEIAPHARRLVGWYR